MHRFRYNQGFLLAGNDVMTFCPLEGALFTISQLVSIHRYVCVRVCVCASFTIVIICNYVCFNCRIRPNDVQQVTCVMGILDSNSV